MGTKWYHKGKWEFDDDWDEPKLEFSKMKIDDFVIGIDVYNKRHELFGTVVDLNISNITIETKEKSKFTCPLNRILSYEFTKKNSEFSKINPEDIGVGLKIYSASLYPKLFGTIVDIKDDRVEILTVSNTKFVCMFRHFLGYNFQKKN